MCYVAKSLIGDEAGRAGDDFSLAGYITFWGLQVYG